jgi:hypothetical protein
MQLYAEINIEICEGKLLAMTGASPSAEGGTNATVPDMLPIADGTARPAHPAREALMRAASIEVGAGMAPGSVGGMTSLGRGVCDIIRNKLVTCYVTVGSLYARLQIVAHLRREDFLQRQGIGDAAARFRCRPSCCRDPCSSWLRLLSRFALYA